MKIGFFLQWMVGSLGEKNKWNVVGEELLALGWCKELMKLDSSIEADIYSYNKQPQEKLDIMIYMNYNTKPIDAFSKKRLMYVENDFGDHGNLSLIHKHFADFKFDGMLCYSKKGCKYFENLGYKTYYFPFSVDTDIYKPVSYDKSFDYDIAYVGSNIKGKKKTEDFFSVALQYSLGLFGNWKTNVHKFVPFKQIKNKGYKFDIYDFATMIRNYILKFKQGFNAVLLKKSQGKIAQNNMIKLLSSSKINLNLTLPGNQNLDIINYRIMEVFACKGFVISDYSPILEETFKDAIICVKNKKDLKKQIDYYLSHPEERQRRAEKGYEIVQKGFTTKQRAKELYNIIMELP